MSSNDHGACPHCGVNLNGGSIWEAGLEFARLGKHYHQRGVPAASNEEACRLADEYAAAYGASRDHGKWGLHIAVYDMATDRTQHYQCPDCGGTWKR